MKGNTHETAAVYVGTVRRFCAWLAQARPQVQAWTDVSPQDVRHYVKSKSMLAPSSRTQIVSVLKMFWRWLVRNGLASDYAAGDLFSPKLGSRLPFMLPQEAVARLLDGLKQDTWLAKRDRAMLELSYSSLLGSTEIQMLELADVDLTQRKVRVHTRHAKTRTVPMNGAAAQALESWIEVRGPRPGPLFLPRRRIVRRLAISSINHAFHEAGKLAGLDFLLTPMKLKSAAIIHFLDGGANLVQVKCLAGHLSMGTTERYERASITKLIAELQRIGWREPPGPGSEKDKTGEPHPAEEG